MKILVMLLLLCTGCSTVHMDDHEWSWPSEDIA